MLDSSRRLLDFRKRIVKLLTEQFGYSYENKYKRQASFGLNAWLKGPNVDAYDLNFALEDINTGEAYYRADFASTEMEFLGLDLARPDNLQGDKPRLSRAETLIRYFEYMLCGYEFTITRDQLGYDRKLGGKVQYGVVQYVNWVSPKQNQFTVYEGWRGVRNDGVSWDLIVTINYIPVVAVMIAPTTPGHRPCEEAYNEMRRQLDADPCLSTYLFCCIISDGKTTLVGGPDDPASWFFPWDAGKEMRTQAREAGVREPLLPFYALLEPERLTTFMRCFVRPVGEEIPIRYVATSHQYEAVLAAVNHLKTGKGAGYVVLPEAEDSIRSYPFENNYNTTRELLIDYTTMSSAFEGIDEENTPAENEASMRFVVQPTLSATQEPGKCVYRPKTPLKSPLAD